MPHGRDVGRGKRDKGSWGDRRRRRSSRPGRRSPQRFERITDKYPRLEKTNNLVHLGTLGTGNHFIELCLDEEAARVGDAPLGLARRRQCDRQLLHRAGEAGHAQVVHQPARREPRLLPGRDRAFRRLCRGGRLGAGLRGAEPADDDDQRHRRAARRRSPSRSTRSWKRSTATTTTCTRENHFGENVLVTRKGAVRAAEGRDGHHPGLDGREIVHRARPRQRRNRSTAAATARGA